MCTSYDGPVVHRRLIEEELQLVDRLGFACRYLPDSDLLYYLDRVSETALAAGDIAGMIVEGSGEGGIGVLGTYVDRTADVQSACILQSVIIAAMPPSSQELRVLRSHARTAVWLESYRELLDRWKLWLHRARFDVDRGKAMRQPNAPAQIYVRCTFCNTSVMPSRKARGPVSSRYRDQGTGRAAVMACPSCRKPLPRCSICLQNMGTGSNMINRGGTSRAGAISSSPSSSASPPSSKSRQQETEAYKVQRFERWFSWCQTCKHGGHAGHMQEWFESHSECPVSGCSCTCAKLDPVVTIVADVGGEEGAAAGNGAGHSAVFSRSGVDSALQELKAGWKSAAPGRTIQRGEPSAPQQSSRRYEV